MSSTLHYFYIFLLLGIEGKFFILNIIDLSLERFESFYCVLAENDLVVKASPSTLQPELFFEVLLFQSDQNFKTFFIISFFEEDLGEFKGFLMA